MSQFEELLKSYIVGLEHPEVSGFELLEVLEKRSALAEFEDQLDDMARRQLEEADALFMGHAVADVVQTQDYYRDKLGFAIDTRYCRALFKRTCTVLARSRLCLVFTILICSALPATAEDETPTAQELLERFDQMYESTGTSARIEIEITRPNKTRTMRMRTWSEGEDKALIVIEAPARDAGTATLKVGRNLWNYLPKISRTIRVPPALMLGSWMGSDLTNDDLVRESSYAEDYAAKLIGPSEDPPGWLVEIVAKPGVPGLWERVEIVFSRAEQLPILGRYYDRKGRLGRTMRMEDIEKVGDRFIATRITVVPEREEGQRTVLTYLHVEFDVELEENLFSLAQLERKR